ncbi:DNA-directed RNA polymerase subunit beta [Candidatus Kuenenbacteria bacterium RIFCSPLOWO2_12_FULL_42_13]|uniref:DNA-directed RNA polymerase subunit beta n=4 Tax=Candidatus Kueneniibacteriota TaxID=1752740 RepID=A0A0G1BAX0_9BACT|nr:MAG: DNA-directed RNA polymerase subunit beta [Candidatus Kuenenbacteria bacterium GW2011_GWA2_42_15]OGG89832.1 MAG: DNA-directed RNA polymerase subunit beta [Candidatus Kuenenbacteria bacterium RIFCSPHIGHO2_02_FULL_42_29]OGG91731.1 MAG: DNA-directed RNA polymerase subunit beta [Candidatus Kuenenbacteria bacterium RIFCSPLOWO2_02_FULL_42_16]OGG92180.1 MAG: DNA-directed RNA polymerase subunit beta [Candidatus Kuenenbacteria bacterium RIFCSPLOWO2_12_FULL_42_13]OGH00988.1 MAG: DNA-directed RNA p
MPTVTQKNERFYFGKKHDVHDLPDLIESQKNSYHWFVTEGLKELFEEVNPIKDYIGRDLELFFLDYFLDEPRFDEVVAKKRNTTYEAALRVKTKLVNKRTGEIKEQEVYLTDFPLMTDRGTFIINGIERVIVSQLIRSAGVFFTSEYMLGKRYYGAKIIPNRGAWLEIETNINGIISVKIDRKRKVPVTSLLRAFGYTTEAEIKEFFKDIDILPDFKYIDIALEKDPAKTEADGVREVYKRIRPGDLATTENARSLIHSMFFNFDRYDFGKVGRYKLNQRFGENYSLDRDDRVFKKNDLLNILREIIKLNINQREADDIDHLGNRRIRAVGELIQNRFRLGLARMERAIIDKMSTVDISSITPAQLINARPIMGAVKEFFMSSQLSQFMDQTNLLAELEHKRRISAMGPGGLSRERAGFEVRDVHRTHYGRICPIATPEGPNIGLVGHLASYARVNNYGFIETPYRKVEKDNKDGQARVTDEIVYLDAFTEEKATTTAATTAIDKDGYFLEDKAAIRKEGEPVLGTVAEIDYMDVAPNQIVSIGTSLIPFLEHNDAVRALMGTNMQRQAVPIVKPAAPLVATGVEGRAAKDSGQVLVAERDGVVLNIQADKIEILDDDGEIKSYNLVKFVRSNASTCLNQRVIVEKRQKVDKGEVLADAAACDHGELALGQNLLVAFIPWEGGNYEDAILISEKLVHNDKFSSIHIEDYIIDVRETKLGPEVVTRDIPNIGEEKLKNLDEDGVVRIGAEVSSGDILVGKITPKGETELTAEERLLRAIFGEKAKEVRDTSLYLEHGEHGKVVDIKIFTRAAGDKLPAGVIRQIQISIAHMRKVQVGDKMAGRHGNKGVVSRVVAVEDMPCLPDGHPVDIILNPLGVASRMNLGQILETHLGLVAHDRGLKVVTPPLDGVPEETIKDELEKLGYSRTGKMILTDGRTGENFQEPSTVGYIYMMKLVHMVEDKIHQRSIGPYSLVTQQPLGGKAQFGGQRFGEMEVWALEAYGAAYTLQEILTIKSDDVPGRSKAYESIIKGEAINKLNIPESFNVLVRELKGLCLDVELLQEGKVISKDDEFKMVEGSRREAPKENFGQESEVV